MEKLTITADYPTDNDFLRLMRLTPLLAGSRKLMEAPKPHGLNSLVKEASKIERHDLLFQFNYLGIEGHEMWVEESEKAGETPPGKTFYSTATRKAYAVNTEKMSKLFLNQCAFAISIHYDTSSMPPGNTEEIVLHMEGKLLDR
ncbi:MAG: hypothetical protein HC841_05450 [Verrucomicrobiae bacterium]|nr:hypothetical protein [Verrucomicrobiae bacterium]